jgi:glycerol 2-dehydrogenase (NADP+)
MSASVPKLLLNNGLSIPAIGLGTWQSKAGEVQDAVYHALKSGYRHIDAAFVYGNENEVGAGIKAALDTGIVTREDIFVTSKVWCTYHRTPGKCLDESLKMLGLDYVDLYLMHWPVPMNPRGSHPLFPERADGSRDLDSDWTHIQTYREMEKLFDTGKTKAIGVSNYSVKFLRELLANVRIVPAVNQIENHPLLPQQDIVDFCNWKGIIVEAFSPLGSTGSPLFSDESIRKVAAKHGVDAGSVLINYQGRLHGFIRCQAVLTSPFHLVSKGHVVLPKSVTPSRIEENLKIITLDTADMESLENIHKVKCTKRYVYPAFGVSVRTGSVIEFVTNSLRSTSVSRISLVVACSLDRWSSTS